MEVGEEVEKVKAPEEQQQMVEVSKERQDIVEDYQKIVSI